MTLRLCILCLLLVSSMGAGRFHKFKFRIKTEKNSVINTTIEGYDVDNAKYRLNKRYPNCKIISTTDL